MFVTDKMKLVADYLGFRFPMCDIETTADLLGSTGYRIDRGGRTDHFIVSRELFDECDKEALLPVLVQLDLYNLFSQAKGRKVLLGNGGITFE
jgi:hypothetical protein